VLDASQVHRIVTGAQRAGLAAAVSAHWPRHAALDCGAPAHLVQAPVGDAILATTSRYTFLESHPRQEQRIFPLNLGENLIQSPQTIGVDKCRAVIRNWGWPLHECDDNEVVPAYLARRSAPHP
jgi:hypothetical protein